MQLLLYDHLSDVAADNFYVDDSKKIIICNAICIAVAFIFFVIELIQMYELGPMPYLKDARSYEIIWFFVQSLYFYLKVTNT
jgi:hypothetical protein